MQNVKSGDVKWSVTPTIHAHFKGKFRWSEFLETYYEEVKHYEEERALAMTARGSSGTPAQRKGHAAAATARF